MHPTIDGGLSLVVAASLGDPSSIDAPLAHNASRTVVNVLIFHIVRNTVECCSSNYAP